MRIAVTGADGFVGRAVVRELGARQAGELLLIDRAFAAAPAHPFVAGDLTDPAVLARACEADALIHLAALPGAAAERDPALSRTINLDLPLALIEGMAGRRLILASSIAVFGGVLPDPVDDATEPRPASVYGTHKRMVELAFADAVRRGAVGGMALRLPGIVARPRGAGGFGSAFLSDLFHAARSGEAYTVPVAREATSWLMSARVCAANLAHALLSDASEGDAVTLPALRVEIGTLTDALGGDFTFEEDERLRAAFGSYPTLLAPRAKALGFRADAGVAALIAAAYD
ncbi:NAD-dependent epimerase/dehydratase family protein [Sphingomonas sp. Y38-1Y]|uniref:NAD-dependent epimerase/dehydratase family protein n=1 Tax=Sphingomonas sp. Y38-1Y TaxID=3078265 RepID=UPI0028E74605|nr:NAD-dependent epimerase/dehydratase family protein [Sphingomonas sp. Y38-1Y]